MDEKIVYLVKTRPGGIDGQDTTDKGGQICHAVLSRATAEGYAKSFCTVEPIVVDFDEVYQQAMNKLSKIERLVLMTKGVK